MATFQTLTAAILVPLGYSLQNDRLQGVAEARSTVEQSSDTLCKWQTGKKLNRSRLPCRAREHRERYELPNVGPHRQVAPLPHTYFMQTLWQWLEHVADDPSAADNLATLIAQAGAVGISLDRLRKVVRLSPESLQDVLKGLLASKQVVLLKVNGARVYRAA